MTSAFCMSRTTFLVLPWQPVLTDGAVVTHGGQRGGAGPVLCLYLGRLVGVWGLSGRKLGRLNDSFDVFVHICGAGEGGLASAGRDADGGGGSGIKLTLFVDGRFPVDVASIICKQHRRFETIVEIKLHIEYVFK